jgi:hypothetical protein
VVLDPSKITVFDLSFLLDFNTNNATFQILLDGVIDYELAGGKPEVSYQRSISGASLVSMVVISTSPNAVVITPCEAGDVFVAIQLP